MIPKKLHYCWLGPDKIPESLVKCMSTWEQLLPDYEIICWDTKKFDVNSNKFTAQAFSVRKWAFASDYIRIFALFTEGGFYLDTDVIVKKRFDEFLNYGFVTSVEYHRECVEECDTLSLLNEDGTPKIANLPKKPGIGMQAAILGGTKGHPFLKSLLDWYQDKDFIQSDGSFYDKIIAPDIYAMVAENYGFKFKDVQQNLREDMLILPSEYFAGAPPQATERSYAIHCCAASWHRDEKTKSMTSEREGVMSASLKRIKRNKLLRKIFRKKPPPKRPLLSEKIPKPSQIVQD